MADSMVKGLPPSLRAGSVKTVGNLMPTSSQCGGQGGAGAACALARQMEDLEGADLARMDDSDPDGIQPGDDVGHIARRNGDRSGVERHR